MDARVKRSGWGWWGVAWLVLILGVAVGYRVVRPPLLDRCELLREGMTEAEVEALLGRPEPGRAGFYYLPDGGHQKFWGARGVEVVVGFGPGEGGRLTRAYLDDGAHAPRWLVGTATRPPQGLHGMP